jgi:glutaredoxin
MTDSEPLKLYVKSWCGWCVDARAWLDEHGYRYELLDVEADRQAAADMLELSGQRRCPTLVAGDLVLPDFGTDELEVFLKKHSIKP